MLTIVNGVTSKQVLANEIINLLETMGLDGYFYLGYPVLVKIPWELSQIWENCFSDMFLDNVKRTVSLSRHKIV